MQLFTDRLYLREFTQNDYNFLYELERNEFTQKYESDTLPTKEDVDRQFSRILESIGKTPRVRYTMLIAKRDDDTPVGKVVMWEIDSSIKEWEIGWDVHPDHIGKSYAPEAACALLEFAFNELGVHRVQALCNDRNINSEKVMIKIGMKKEGTCRGVRFLNNSWDGSHIYSMLDSDLGNEK